MRSKVNYSDSSFVEIGKIVKAQGLDGKLKVMVYSGDPGSWLTFNDIYVGHKDALHPYALLNSRSHGKFAIIALADVSDRNASEALVGGKVWVNRNQMPSLQADEFYWHEMVGLIVKTDQGQELGRVTSLIATGAHDVMVVTAADNNEYLIPAIQEFIVRHDLEKGELVIAPPPGLLEMNLSDAI